MRYALICPSGASRVQECLYTHMVLHPDPEVGRFSITSSRAGELLLTQLGQNWRAACGLDPDVKLMALVRQGAAQLFTVAEWQGWNKVISISAPQRALLEAAEQRWGGPHSHSDGGSGSASTAAPAGAPGLAAAAAAGGGGQGTQAILLSLARHMIGFFTLGLRFHCLSVAQGHEAVSKFLGPDWQRQLGPGQDLVDLVNRDSCLSVDHRPSDGMQFLELNTVRLLRQHGPPATVTAVAHSSNNSSSSSSSPVPG
ncbi:MAG: hypothetical protein OSW71_18480, partial [Proteobacteria bacterium]|nr:hypothetical protein [Pseudomonadota bacterium]